MEGSCSSSNNFPIDDELLNSMKNLGFEDEDDGFLDKLFPSDDLDHLNASIDQARQHAYSVAPLWPYFEVNDRDSNSNSTCEPSNAETLSGRTMRTNSYSGPSSSNSSTKHFYARTFLNEPSSMYNGGMSDYMSRNYLNSNHQFNLGRRGGGFYSGGINIAGSSSLQNQHVEPVVNLVILAKTENGSQYLQSILQIGNSQQKSFVFLGVYESIVELMTDKWGSRLVLKILDSCGDFGLKRIVMKIYDEINLFLNAAFYPHGSQSIQKLIKVLKKTSYASHLTLVLSLRFYELTTHHISRHVIVQCLNLLGYQANEVLFQQAIKHFKEMAIHQQGCLSLNECINNICGLKRYELLNLIAEESSYLSNDPLGNYVVQHVLGLQNSKINDRICELLRGQYIQLSMKKGGSHVVEKCITFSRLGLNYAGKEFLSSTKVLVHLARDQYGNYVIQKALIVSKEINNDLFKSLVTVLQQHTTELSRSSNGRHVLQLIQKLTEA